MSQISPYESNKMSKICRNYYLKSENLVKILRTFFGRIEHRGRVGLPGINPIQLVTKQVSPLRILCVSTLAIYFLMRKSTFVYSFCLAKEIHSSKYLASKKKREPLHDDRDLLRLSLTFKVLFTNHDKTQVV